MRSSSSTSSRPSAPNLDPMAIASAIASAAGVAVSVYLTFPEQVTASPLCDISATFSCTSVLSSQYAEFLGVPVAVYGAAWFSVSLFLSIIATSRERAVKFLFLWSVLGMLGVGALVLVEAFLIGSFCIYCTVAHVLAALVFANAYLIRSEAGTD